MKRTPLKRSVRRKIGPSKVLRSKLIKSADTLMSLYVRQFYAKDGMVKCYTCTGVYPVKKIQNGHYIPRGYKYTRWELENCRPQCFLCNCRYYGQAFIFRKNLVEELGEERVRELEARAKNLFNEKDEWIQEIIDLYTSKLSTLETKCDIV